MTTINSAESRAKPKKTKDGRTHPWRAQGGPARKGEHPATPGWWWRKPQ